MNATFTAPDVDASTALTFRLTVTDDDGASDADDVVITVVPGADNQPPTADAGDDQTVTAGDTVFLDGTGSSDPDGTISGYAWSQRSGPTVALAADIAQPTFTAPTVAQNTVLTFRLTVTDNRAATATDVVLITVRPASSDNQAPVADAGTDLSVTAGDSVILSGVSSSDADGTISGYAWTQTGGPTVTLTGAATATASFTAPAVTKETVLTFRLTVTDDDGVKDDDTVRVTVDPAPANQAPDADAGANQTVMSGAAVTLSGSNSSDADGTIASYAWSQTVGPTVTLTGAATATATFTAPTVTRQTLLWFRLTVSDDDGATDQDLVRVTVDTAASNQAPTANAGLDQTVLSGEAVALSGASSVDADGTIASYAWTQTAGTTVTLTGAKTVSAGFTAPTVTEDTVLTFRLTVTDDDGATDTDDVSITVAPAPVNKPPVADAGDDENVTSGDSVSLIGNASSDPDGLIAAYAWRQTAGTTVVLSGASSATATFTAPTVQAKTVLTFRLTVTDDDNATDTDDVSITVSPAPANKAPTADAGVDQTVTSGDTVYLMGTGSSDSDGVISTYAWSQQSGPTVSLTDADTAHASFTAPTVTQLTQLQFRLTVTDDDAATDTDSVVVSVRPGTGGNDAPTADAGTDQTVTAGDSVTLWGINSSDSDGTISSYAWTQTGGTTVTLNGAETGTASFTAPDVAQDTVLTFKLTVTDDDGATDDDSVRITVEPAPANQAPVADAGEDHTVYSGAEVALSGASSSDFDGTINSYAWTQTAGTP